MHANSGRSCRPQKAKPFIVTGVVAIVAGGLLAAAFAHQASRPLMWAVAYLVLVVGVVQYLLGMALPALRPDAFWNGARWLCLNLGHAAVMAGSLLPLFGCLVLGTALYDIAMLWIAATLWRGLGPGWRRIAYTGLCALMGLSSLIGVFLSAQTV